jgi:hypothetical protein
MIEDFQRERCGDLVPCGRQLAVQSDPDWRDFLQQIGKQTLQTIA